MAHPGGGDGGPSDAGAAADTASPDAPLPVAFCEEACAAPLADGCFSDTSCRAACEAQAAGWSEPVREAFAGCAAEDPLCFRTLEDCMLERLHPTAEPHRVRIDGAGLSAFEGLTVHAFSDPMRPPAMQGEAVIVGGAFTLEWTFSAPATVIDDTVILLYVDVDGDGRCRSAIDVTAALQPTWNGDLVDPAFALELTPPLSDADFVCAYAP
jgi:hypothetical protein